VVGSKESIEDLFPDWKPMSLGRLALIAGFAALLVAGLVDRRVPSQHVLWLTDHDEILPNQERSKEALYIFAQWLQRFVPDAVGDVSWLTPGNDEKNSIEDLVAIPDLVAGAMADFLTNTVFAYHDTNDEAFDVEIERQIKLSKKTETILDWHTECHHPLARIAVVVDTCESAEYRTWVFDHSNPEQRKPEYDWREEGLIRIVKSHGAYDAIMTDLNESYIRLPFARFDQEQLMQTLNSLRRETVRFSSKS